jgi:hypothetical protein
MAAPSHGQSLRKAIIARAMARTRAAHPGLPPDTAAIVEEAIGYLLEELDDSRSAKHRQNGGEPPDAEARGGDRNASE